MSSSNGPQNHQPGGQNDTVQPSPSRKRARENWLKVSQEIKKRVKVDNIASTLMGIPRGEMRKLCGVCARMKLTPNKFKVPLQGEEHLTLEPDDQPTTPTDQTGNPLRIGRFDPASGKAKYPLGSLKQIKIRSKHCPLCSLILMSAQEQVNEDLSENPKYSSVTCSASWQLDGRELVDSEGTSIPTARTRRIRLEWKSDQIPDCYIVLLPDQPWARDNLFMGRHAEGSRANLTLIKSWIDLCHRGHSDTCQAKPNLLAVLREQPYFAVVDVKTMKLTQLPPDAEYIALSYTWGKAARFTTSRRNVNTLRRDNGVEGIKDQIPRAIQDAIRLTKNLEKRYLWVDALCIVQDSPTSWKLNARIMDQVYGNAYLTICAADDPDASAGLVALDPSKRQFAQYIEQYSPGVDLMVSHLSETYIQRSHWNTRGWTFQERLLSRRCLLFARGRVYFQCRSTAMSEDIIAEHDGASWSIELVHAPLQLLRDLPARALQVYTRCVELYTHRQLSRSSDILNAFNGISNLIALELKADFIFGLPNSHFDWALLWEPKNLILQRRESGSDSQNLQDGPMQGEAVNFPTWSWCGWKGDVHYKPSTALGTLTNLHEWLKLHTWIIWYIRDGQGMLRLVKSCETPTTGIQNYQVDRWTGYPSHTHGPDITCDHDQYGRVNREGVGRADIFHRTLPDFPFSTSKVPCDVKPDKDLPDMPFLQFWTWSAHFRLTYDTRDLSPGRGPSDNKLKRLGIADRKGDWCGTVVLDRDWMETLRANGHNVTYEFLAISDAKEFSQEEYNDWNYYIQCERDQSEWDLYYVLLIEHNEEGYATRVGFGKVYQDAFENSFKPGKGWREFILG